MRLPQCRKSHVCEEQFLVIIEMARLLWIIHTVVSFFILAFLWVFAYGLQSPSLQLLLYSALCPAPLSQSDYKVIKYLCVHVPDLPTVGDTIGSPGVQVLGIITFLEAPHWPHRSTSKDAISYFKNVKNSMKKFYQITKGKTNRETSTQTQQCHNYLAEGLR